jgi:hypothetical protein
MAGWGSGDLIGWETTSSESVHPVELAKVEMLGRPTNHRPPHQSVIDYSEIRILAKGSGPELAVGVGPVLAGELVLVPVPGFLPVAFHLFDRRLRILVAAGEK